MGFAFVLFSYLALRSLHSTPTVMLYGLLQLPIFFLASLGNPLRSALAGGERAAEVSLSDLFLSASPLLAVPFLRYGAIALIYATLFGSLAALLIKVRWLRGSVKMQPIFNVSIWVQLIRGGAPFMLNTYASSLYGYVTLLVLNHFLNTTAVGEYNQANRLIGTFLIVPTVLSAALLPTLTRLAHLEPAVFMQAKIRVLVVLIVSCFPIIAGVILLAEPLCHLLYGAHKFAHVPLALQMGAVLLLPLYIVTTIYQFLVAQNRNGIWSVALLGTLCLNALLAWVLVPYTLRMMNNGIVGAFFSMTISEFTATWFAFALIKINPFTPQLLGPVLRGAAATGLAALAIWATRVGIAHLVLPFALSAALELTLSAVVGAAVFLFLSWQFRAFPPEEQRLVMNTLRRKFRKNA